MGWGLDLSNMFYSNVFKHIIVLMGMMRFAAMFGNYMRLRLGCNMITNNLIFRL